MFRIPLTPQEVHDLALETAKRVTPEEKNLEATVDRLLENYYQAKCLIEEYVARQQG